MSRGLLFDEFDDRPAPQGRDPLTVSELTAQLKGLVEDTFNHLAVIGEISNCRAASSGHIYFTLKDDHAQVRGALFRREARLLKFRLEDGMRVIVRGRLSVYEVKGEYQTHRGRDRAARPGRVAGGIRAAQARAAGRGSVRRRRANGRCRCCRAASAS